MFDFKKNNWRAGSKFCGSLSGYIMHDENKVIFISVSCITEIQRLNHHLSLNFLSGILTDAYKPKPSENNVTEIQKNKRFTFRIVFD